MKKLIPFLFLLFVAKGAFAQSELPSDSIRQIPSENVKKFGDFLLDMSMVKAVAPKLPQFKLDIPNLTKDYNQLFRFNPDVIYTQGFTDTFSPSSLSGFGYGWGIGNSPQFMQSASFKLKNGMRITTYGDYNAKGWKVPNRSAMPWEKNNFRGAFELKSANGAFGIRFEVQHGRNSLY